MIRFERKYVVKNRPFSQVEILYVRLLIERKVMFFPTIQLAPYQLQDKVVNIMMETPHLLFDHSKIMS